MRRRVMMIKTLGKNREDAVAGDILCAKADGTKFIFDASDYPYIANTDWTPIGIVTVPPSHDIYETGEGSAINLKYIYSSSPDSGYKNQNQVYWGGRIDDILDLPDYNKVNITDNITNTIQSATEEYGYIPLDYKDTYGGTSYTSEECITDPLTYYSYRTSQASRWNRIPSPYLVDGSRNPIYSSTEKSKLNILSDLDGKSNTEIICTHATGQSGWKTDSSINNYADSGYYPPACLAWRYHTIGTNSGDWYLPTAGESGYIPVRYTKIRNSILNVNGGDIDNPIWTSTEYGIYSVYIIYMSTGSITATSKSSQTYVRLFTRF